MSQTLLLPAQDRGPVPGLSDPRCGCAPDRTRGGRFAAPGDALGHGRQRDRDRQRRRDARGADARRKSGLKQRELAEPSGVDQGDINRIERGVLAPTTPTRLRLADPRS